MKYKIRNLNARSIEYVRTLTNDEKSKISPLITEGVKDHIYALDKTHNISMFAFHPTYIRTLIDLDKNENAYKVQLFIVNEFGYSKSTFQTLDFPRGLLKNKNGYSFDYIKTHIYDLEVAFITELKKWKTDITNFNEFIIKKLDNNNNFIRDFNESINNISDKDIYLNNKFKQINNSNNLFFFIAWICFFVVLGYILSLFSVSIIAISSIVIPLMFTVFFAYVNKIKAIFYMEDNDVNRNYYYDVELKFKID